VKSRTAHPFILDFYCTFKDEKHVYFIHEYLEGISLDDAIRQIGLLRGKEARFYIGAIVLIVEYLQSHDVIHRDLKPDNFMIDKFGYPKLIDMGAAKILESHP